MVVHAFNPGTREAEAGGFLSSRPAWSTKCCLLYTSIIYIHARWWWCMPLIPALGRQRQVDFWVRGQPGLQSKFQDSQVFTEKPRLEKQTNNKKDKRPHGHQPTQAYQAAVRGGASFPIKARWGNSVGERGPKGRSQRQPLLPVLGVPHGDKATQL